jgi:HlyD family secretion protein
VITWINEDIGRKVSAGEPLVRIANLNRFRVEASTSDRNTGSINVGMPVEVRINATNLKGSISSVLPEVVNNTVKFLVELEDAENAILRPNMRAEVYIITDKKDDVLRVKNGSAFKGASSQDIFVVEGDKAIKRRIGKGLVNSDYVEITQNLNEGEQIIISSTEDFDHLDEFIIREK